MCSFRFALALVLLAACNHDSSVGSNHPDAPSSPDSGSGGSDSMQQPVECTGTKLFAMNGPVVAAHIEATKPLMFVLGGQTNDVMGARGELTDGTFFYMRRDGDFGDGDLAQIGNYDVSQYPYNIQFSHAPVAHEGCESTPGCADWLAVSGTFSVTQVQPVYRATFTLSMLCEGDSPGGTPITGSVTGCLAVPNP